MPNAVYIQAAASGFQWGWDTFVALGTLLLAISTGSLAWITRRVATKTGEVASKTQELAQETKQLAVETKRLASATSNEVAGQHRPVLVTQPGDPPAVRAAAMRAGRVQDLKRACGINRNDQLWINLHNSGPGAALNIEVLMDEEMGAPRAASPWDAGALPTGGEAVVFFDGVTAPQDTVLVTVSYRDVADRVYQSNIVIERVAGIPTGQNIELRVRDVKVEAI